MRRALGADDAPEATDVLEDAGELGLELLMEWIATGPGRPPDSEAELLAWGRERGLVG